MIQPPEDQTLFINQEPWLEDGTSQVKPVPPVGATQPRSRRNSILIIMGLFSLLAILILALVVLIKPQPATVTASPTPVASNQPMATDPFQQRFSQVKADLKAADPAKRELPFPPIDVKIQLKYGEKKR
jgi:hypothetical protein